MYYFKVFPILSFLFISGVQIGNKVFEAYYYQEKVKLMVN